MLKRRVFCDLGLPQLVIYGDSRVKVDGITALISGVLWTKNIVYPLQF